MDWVAISILDGNGADSSSLIMSLVLDDFGISLGFFVSIEVVGDVGADIDAGLDWTGKSRYGE